MLEDDVAVAKRVARASIAIPSAVAIAKSATGAAIAVVSDVTISCYCHGQAWWWNYDRHILYYS